MPAGSFYDSEWPLNDADKASEKRSLAILQQQEKDVKCRQELASCLEAHRVKHAKAGSLLDSVFQGGSE